MVAGGGEVQGASRVSKLKLGLIPKGTECPFKDQCGIQQAGDCKHKGVLHSCDFSCASARGFDLIQRDRPIG
jgi:hypothetical protein